MIRFKLMVSPPQSCVTAVLCATLTTGFALLNQVALANPSPQSGFAQAGSSENLSQLIRSNAPHFWETMKLNPRPEIATFLKFTGVVAGDPHLGNFSIVPVSRVGSRDRELKFLNVDFDDAGVGPFVLDFVRFEVSVSSITDKIESDELVAAYVKGLNQVKLPTPRQIKRSLDMNIEAYDAQVLKYVLDHSSKTKFDYDKKKLVKYNDLQPTEHEIKKLMSDHGFNTIDIAQRPRERGGSRDSLRIWVLSGDKKDRQIVELKEMARAGVDHYQDQMPDPQQWLAQVQRAFWPGIDGSSYKIVWLGKKWFWMRRKEVGLIDVPYTSRSKENIEFVKDLAIYDANQLGLVHGRQASAKGYIEAIKENSRSFQSSTQSVAEWYLKLAAEAMSQRKPSR